MDRYGFLFLTFLFLVVLDFSDVFLLWNSRKLGVSALDSNSTIPQNSSVPRAGGKKSGSNLTSGNKPVEERTRDTHTNVVNNSSKVGPNGSGNKSYVSPPIGKQTEVGMNHQEKSGSKTNMLSRVNETCDGKDNWCKQKELVACVLTFENASKELVLLVQNEGNITMKLNLTIPTSSNAAVKELQVPKHQTEMINISVSISQKTKLVFNAGSGNCLLHIGPDIPGGIFSYRLPPYSKAGIPIYGAFILFSAALIAGASWALCKFRKRTQLHGNSYQELEMGLPESAAPVSQDETTQGWDDGWDDNWDEDKAVTSIGGHNVGSISGYGLTSRSSNRDGWEIDWDD